MGTKDNVAVWTIAFDVYENEEDKRKGIPKREGCFLDAELTKEEWETIDRIVQKYVKQGKYQG